jgi:hypothetical protein
MLFHYGRERVEEKIEIERVELTFPKKPWKGKLLVISVC